LEEAVNLRRLRIVLIAVFLLYGTVLTVNSVSGFPHDFQDSRFFPYLADKPLDEDGYYMLTVSWNMAKGHGIVYNYDKATTGVQPLSTYVYAGLAKLTQSLNGDKWLFARTVLLFGIVNLLLFAHLNGAIARTLVQDQQSMKQFAYPFAFIGAAFSFAIFRMFTLGLETGIYLTLLAACILYTLALPRRDDIRFKQIIILGILAGLTGLARIDFGVVLLFFLGLSLLGGQLQLRQVLTIGIIALSVVSPWFIYTYSVTGSLMPSSGTTQMEFVSTGNLAVRSQWMVRALVSQATPWMYSNVVGNRGLLLVIVSFATLVTFVVYLVRDKNVRKQLTTTLKLYSPLSNWTIAIMLLILIYLLFFASVWFYRRYSTPIFVPLFALLTVGLATKLHSRSNTVQLVALSVIPASFFVWAFFSLHAGNISRFYGISAGFIKANHITAKVGAVESGTIGYFNPNIVNLDGKVDHDALQARLSGALASYIDQEQIDVLVFNSIYFRGFDQDWLAANWEPCEPQAKDGITLCLIRKRPSSPLSLRPLPTADAPPHLAASAASIPTSPGSGRR
jgi:hypothetical protein